MSNALGIGWSSVVGVGAFAHPGPGLVMGGSGVGRPLRGTAPLLTVRTRRGTTQDRIMRTLDHLSAGFDHVRSVRVGALVGVCRQCPAERELADTPPQARPANRPSTRPRPERPFNPVWSGPPVAGTPASAGPQCDITRPGPGCTNAPT